MPKQGNPLNWKLRVTMPDGSKYDVPVALIAANRAQYYAGRDGISFEESLTNGTIPLFLADDYAIEDWAVNSMDWSDVAKSAVRVGKSSRVDYQEGWLNGDKQVVHSDAGAQPWA